MNTCSNCQKEFPEDKVHLHEAYCLRNFRKCPHCDEFVDLKEMAAHELELHADQTCLACGQTYKPSQKLEHEETCPERPLNCEYCELDVAFSTFKTHQDVCSAKTKKCDNCQQYVTLKQFKSHVCRPASSSSVPRQISQQAPVPVQAPPPLPLRHQISQPQPQISHFPGHHPTVIVPQPLAYPSLEPVNRPYRNQSALHVRNVQLGGGLAVAPIPVPGQPAPKVQKSDKGFLQKKETAPCLVMRPQGYYSVIRAKNNIKELDLIPICMRDRVPVLKQKN